MSTADHPADAAPAGAPDRPCVTCGPVPAIAVVPTPGGAGRWPPAWPAALAALRERGAGLAEPVRWRFLEALARRAAATQGPARTLLDARLEALVAEFADRLQTRAASTGPAPAARPTAPGRAGEPTAPGPLAGLVAALCGDWPSPLAAEPASASVSAPDAAPAVDLGPGVAGPPSGASRHGAQPGRAGAARPRRAVADPAVAPPAELKASRLFGRGWARLAAEAQLQRSQATLPLQTGPLNSERLVLAALQRLQALSPDHLTRLLAQVDALRWLARAEAAPAAPTRSVSRAAPAGRPVPPAEGTAAGAPRRRAGPAHPAARAAAARPKPRRTP